MLELPDPLGVERDLELEPVDDVVEIVNVLAPFGGFEIDLAMLDPLDVGNPLGEPIGDEAGGVEPGRVILEEAGVIDIRLFPAQKPSPAPIEGEGDEEEKLESSLPVDPVEHPATP